MESRIHLLLLRGALLGVLVPVVCGCSRHLQSTAQADEARPVVEPQVERKAAKAPKIRGSDVELGAFVGVLGIEDFGSSFAWGANLAYHISEDFFAEAAYGQAKAGKTSYEVLSGDVQLLTNDERMFRYYGLSLGWNVLPGEVFLGRSHAMNSALYLIAGAGSTRFAGNDYFTFSVGTGYKVLVTDSIAVRVDLRDYLYSSDLLGESKTTNNLQFTLGASWFF